MPEITCTRLEQFMDECNVLDGKTPYRMQYRCECRENAAVGDCPFADRCKDHSSCPLGKQTNTVRPGINPVFLKPSFNPSSRDYYAPTTVQALNVDILK